MKAFARIVGLCVVAAASAAKGEVIPYTYEYNATLMGASGVNFYGGNNGSGISESYENETWLNNGIVGAPVPGGSLWNDGGFELYTYQVDQGTSAQPALTMSLASPLGAGATLTVSYGESTGAGVRAPVSVSISDEFSKSPLVFTGFNTATTNADGGEARLAIIPLTGLTGSTLAVSFTGGGEHLPLSELTVTSVPEPTSLAGLSVAGLLALRRRRRRL